MSIAKENDYKNVEKNERRSLEPTLRNVKRILN